MLFQNGGHAGLITAATGLGRLDRAFFKAQRDQNLARFFLRATLAAFTLRQPGAHRFPIEVFFDRILTDVRREESCANWSLRSS